MEEEEKSPKTLSKNEKEEEKRKRARDYRHIVDWHVHVNIMYEHNFSL